MNKPITVSQLKRFCEEQIRKGKGDNVIMISSDDEGNSYHYLWYSFTTVKEMEEPIKIGDKEYTEEFYYADERIAPKDKTIILG